jgi:hypothetical protein
MRHLLTTVTTEAICNRPPAGSDHRILFRRTRNDSEVGTWDDNVVAEE